MNPPLDDLFSAIHAIKERRKAAGEDPQFIELLLVRDPFFGDQGQDPPIGMEPAGVEEIGGVRVERFRLMKPDWAKGMLGESSGPPHSTK